MRQRHAALPHDQAVEQAREDALRLLEAQARSSANVRAKLAQRGYAQAAIDEVVARLTRVGLLDDQHYAAMLVRTRFSQRGLVGRALRCELAKYGITGAQADSALAQVQAEDVTERARQLALKKLASASVDTANDSALEKLKRRTISYLVRRGYSGNTAMEALHYALAQAQAN